MLPLEHPDRIHVAFDDHRLVANAGLLLPASLALRLGLCELVDQHVDLGHAPGRANPGDKLLTLVMISVWPLSLRSIRSRQRRSRYALSASKLSKDGTGTRKLRRTYPTRPSTLPLSLPFPGRPPRSSNR